MILRTIIALWSGIICLAVADPVIAESNAAPGGIKLLPGYQHEVGRGFDTSVGTIWKKDVLSIGYDIGELSGNEAGFYGPQKSSRMAWYKEQYVNGQKVQLCFMKDRIFHVSVANYANFRAKIESDEALADMLLMVLTYVGPNGQK